MKSYSEEELRLLTQVLPGIAAELRGSLANVYFAANRLAPAEMREQDAQADQNAAIFSQSFFRMYRVICNLSDAAKLGEDTRFTLYNDDIVALCRDVCDKAAPLFELKGVALEFDCDSPAHIIALDAEMMRRLLLNLLSNALKATPGGGRVVVRVRSNPRFVQLSVVDNGCGIPQDRLSSVFDSFLQTDWPDYSPHGAGLGLALCRRIAEGHGGRIMAESAEGAGSTFTVSLPNVKSPNGRLGEPGIDYAGGFNPILVELSDALPMQAFLHQYLD